MQTTKVGQSAYVAQNLLAHDFTASMPLENPITDNTYLPYGQSMMYLSSILDVYNGEIVAQTIGSKQEYRIRVGHAISIA